jgi:hypothetical protein
MVGLLLEAVDDVATGRLASDLRHKKDVESVEQ